jgi:hypothetical protein
LVAEARRVAAKIIFIKPSGFNKLIVGVKQLSMDEQHFYQIINTKAKELGINPLLIISGIEGLYTFRDVPFSELNNEFLDNLIITIFALRIGDRFHAIAEENLSSKSIKVRDAAFSELRELSRDEIQFSPSPYFKSFASLVAGKSVIRKYHEKALEVAALEIKNTQDRFQSNSIGAIILDVCKSELSGDLDLASLFGA